MIDQSYKQAFQFLNSLRQKIDELKTKKDANPLLILKQINEKLKSEHLGIIIMLHNKQYLIKLFESLVALFEQNNKDKHKEIIAQIEVIYAFGHSCFFIYENGYNKFFNYFQKKLSKANIQKNQEKYMKQVKRYEIMFQLIKEFNEINRSDEQNYQKGKRLNQFVERFRLQIPSYSFEEPIFTWLRMRIQILQNIIIKNIKKKDFGFCCRLHFLQNSTENGVQTFGQNFHRYVDFKKLKQKQDIPIHKQIVSYLNSYGGICYLGIQISPTKMAQIHGIPIDQLQRRMMLNNIIQNIVKRIFPDDDEDDDQDEKKQQERINKFFQKKKKDLDACPFSQSKYHYDITKYISIDFINLYNAQTWLYSRQNNIVLYIVRIKVKKGDEYQVYHYINLNQIPKAYQREDKKQKQLTMIQYYDKIYEKLKNKAEKKHQEQKVTAFHQLCRFKIKFEEEKNK